MVRDAKLKSHMLVEMVAKSLSSQPADSIFEKVIDDVETSIQMFTPAKFRK